MLTGSMLPRAPALRRECAPLFTRLSCVVPLALQLEILGAHARKKAEEAEFKAALAAALTERDTEGRDLVAAYDKVHKHVMRAAGAADDPAATEEQVRHAAQHSRRQHRLGRLALFLTAPPAGRIGLGGCLPARSWQRVCVRHCSRPRHCHCSGCGARQRLVAARLAICKLSVTPALPCAAAFVCCCWCRPLQVLAAKVKLMILQEALLGLEVDTAEVVAGLVTKFDRSYSEMAEQDRANYTAYFTRVRAREAACGCDVCAWQLL